jgi:hypothetical protein
MPNTYSSIRRNVRLDYTHEVFFTRDSFVAGNSTLYDLLKRANKGKRTKVLVYLDEGILDGNPNLPSSILLFAKHSNSLTLFAPKIYPGGRGSKK